MVSIVGRRHTKQFLQHPLDVGRVEQILASGNTGDTLQCIVDHHRKVIADGNILTRYDHVTLARGINVDPTPRVIIKIQRAAYLRGLHHVQAQGKGSTSDHASIPFVVRKMSADPRVYWMFPAMWRGTDALNLAPDLLAGTETGIYHIHPTQLAEGLDIVVPVI